MHARRTREKKKYEYTVLQQRVNALHEEVTNHASSQHPPARSCFPPFPDHASQLRFRTADCLAGCKAAPDGG